MNSSVKDPIYKGGRVYPEEQAASFEEIAASEGAIAIVKQMHRVINEINHQ